MQVTRKNLLKVLVTFLLLALTIKIQTSHGVSESSNYHTAQSETYQITLAILVDLLENPKSGIETSNDQYVQKVFQVAYEEGELFGLKLSTNTWVFYDPWGTPYNTDVCGVTITTNAFNEIWKTSRNVVTWSSGPNKINEYGKGDDIVCYDASRVYHTHRGCHRR